MTPCDAIGYLASGLVLGAFSMKNMIQLRIVAICSNLAFIAYGALLDLIPVVALHVVLLPMNTWRLWQVLHPRSDLSGGNIRPAYPMKLLISFAGLSIKLAAVVGFFVITAAMAGWLMVTQAETSAAVPGPHSFDVQHANSPSVPTLVPLW